MSTDKTVFFDCFGVLDLSDEIAETPSQRQRRRCFKDFADRRAWAEYLRSIDAPDMRPSSEIRAEIARREEDRREWKHRFPNIR